MQGWFSGAVLTALNRPCLFLVSQMLRNSDRLQVLSLCGILRRSEADFKNPALKHAVPDNGILVRAE
jgi:hypothetical protein